MNKYILIPALLLFGGCLLISAGCEKGPDFKSYVYPKQSVTGVSPSSGFVTSFVTIKGSNFGALNGSVKVYFGGILATNVVSVVNDQIVVQVPATAISGKVTLSVWTNTIDSIGSYTVLQAPAILSDSSRDPIAPVIAAGGDTVDIKGTNFLTDPSKVSIDFNGAAASQIITLTPTLIQVIAPASYAAGMVNVTFAGFKITAPTALAPSIQPGDVSSYFLKNYKQPLLVNAPAQPVYPPTDANNYGRWFTPKYWGTLDLANHTNSELNTAEGGVDYRPTASDSGVIFGCEAGWGAPTITNGKLYQTVTLLPGTYTFSTDMRENWFDGQEYICAAAGTSLPDGGNINGSTTLGFLAFSSTKHDNGGSDNTHTIEQFNFTVPQKMQVTLGVVLPTLNANSSYGGSFIRFQYFRLVLN